MTVNICKYQNKQPTGPKNSHNWKLYYKNTHFIINLENYNAFAEDLESRKY